MSKSFSSDLFNVTLKKSEYASNVIGIDPTKLSKENKASYEKKLESLREGLYVFIGNFIIQFFHFGYDIGVCLA
jgi:hypothetical protein